ncbi:MAG: LemA family protein [Bacteroidetes bacterium]|nr:LemA family protein [Bacteroidota bacterium]
MKKTGIIIIIVLAAILFLWGMGSYNGLVNSQENVKSQWGNVENQYQRRADLIPNLVETVKGYATHEKSTFEEVIAARAKATQITIDPTNLTPEKLQEFQAAQGQLGSALGRLIAVAENYPELKANQNFLELQAQLEGTENRISVERNKFIEMAKKYDVAIRQFPKNIVAGLFNFEKIPYFTAQEGAEKAPQVKF